MGRKAPEFPDPRLDARAYGKRLFFLRVWRGGWDLDEFATLAGVHPNAVKQQEQGLWLPNLVSAHKIAKAVGLTVDGIMSEPESMDGWDEFSPLWDGARKRWGARWRSKLERSVRSMGARRAG